MTTTEFATALSAGSRAMTVETKSPCGHTTRQAGVVDFQPAGPPAKAALGDRTTKAIEPISTQRRTADSILGGCVGWYPPPRAVFHGSIRGAVPGPAAARPGSLARAPRKWGG